MIIDILGMVLIKGPAKYVIIALLIYLLLK